MKTMVCRGELVAALAMLVASGCKFRYISKVDFAGKVSRHWLISYTEDTKWVRLHLMEMVGKRRVVTLTGRYKALGFDQVKVVGGMDAVRCTSTFTRS